jgi:hypothetical protein
MAEVTSGMVTVIVLNNVEANALAEALRFCAVDGDLPNELDELTNAMTGVDYE